MNGKKRKIVVTGCLAQRYNTQLAADMPEADLVGLWFFVCLCTHVYLVSTTYMHDSTHHCNPKGRASMIKHVLLILAM